MSHTLKNRYFKSIIDQLFLPYKSYGKDMKGTFFGSCEPLRSGVYTKRTRFDSTLITNDAQQAL